MSKRAILFIHSFLIFFSFSFAQKAILKGKITDLETGEALFIATVKVGSGGTTTEIDGSFSLDLEAGDYDLEISYVGYTSFSDILRIKSGENRTLDIALDPTTTILETATVTSGKFQKALGEVTVSMEILKPSLIESTNKTSLDDALQKIPGVTVIDGQANIRGGSGFSQGAGSRVLLLVDDIPILQADSGFPNWDDIPVENIEQVEIVKGAASALYGSSALNGIINVRTAYAKSEPETKGSVFYTTFFDPKNKGYKWWDSAPAILGASLTHKQKLGKLDLVLGSYYINKESHLQDTYKKYGRFNFNTRYRLNDRLTIGINGNFTKGKKQSWFYWAADTIAFTGAPSTFSKNNRFRYNIDPFITYYDKEGNRHKFMGRFYRVDNNLSNNRSNESKLFYGEYQFQRNFTKIKLVATAGVVAMGTNVEAELYGNAEYDSRNVAGFIQLDKRLSQRFNVSAGFRYEKNLLKNPGFLLISPTTGAVLEEISASKEKESKPVVRFGVNYKASANTYLRASVGEGYRYPTIAEKFIFTDVGGFFIIPNPSLTSETGWSAEIGIKRGFTVSSFKGYLDIAAFISKYQDMMEFNIVPNPSFPFAFQAVNIGDTEIKGYEISVGGRGKIFGIPLNILGGYTYIDPRFQEFDTTPIAPGETPTRGQINANNSSSDDNILKYRSVHSFKIDVEAKIKKLSVGLSSFYNSHLEAIDNSLNLIVPGLFRYRQENDNGYNIYDARLGYQLNEHLRLSLILNNIFNTEYAIRPALQNAPRNLTVKANVKL